MVLPAFLAVTKQDSSCLHVGCQQVQVSRYIHTALHHYHHPSVILVKLQHVGQGHGS